MTAAELAERIPGARLRNGGPWFDARCPAGSHGGDDRASLSFADDHDRGRVRLVCRKGCAFASIVAGLNLRQSAFFHAPKGATNGTSPAPERIVYDYRSEAGTIVHRTIRKQFQDGRKDFLQSRPDGKGGWLWTLDGLETLPYRLDRLRAELAALPVGSVSWQSPKAQKTRTPSPRSGFRRRQTRWAPESGRIITRVPS